MAGDGPSEQIMEVMKVTRDPALHAARKMAGRSPALNALASELGVTCEVHSIEIEVSASSFFEPSFFEVLIK